METRADEFFLSAVMHKPVIDRAGRRLGRLSDLLMVPGEPLPVVSHLVIRQGHSLFLLPWAEVTMFNPVAVSARSGLGALSPYAPGDEDVLMGRDILDKQIVDVDGARVVRVNDIVLGELDGVMRACGVDAGFRGLLRRLGWERLGERAATALGRDLPSQVIGWQFVQPLGHDLNHLTLTMTRDHLGEMHPADLAQILSQLPTQNVSDVLSNLDSETAGEAILELDPEDAAQVLSGLDSEHAADILEEMDPDEAADVLGDLPEEKARELLDLMDDEEAEKVQELMEHEEDTAGGLMNNEFLTATADMTVEKALEEVRFQADEVDTIYYLYVLDPDEKLLGTVSLRDLLTAAPATPLSEIMTEKVKFVRVDSEPEEALEAIAKYNLLAVPVLDAEDKMAGVVAVDDILELFLPWALRRKRYGSARDF